jgi:predicted NBD/HSP70 family sugar kinase
MTTASRAILRHLLGNGPTSRTAIHRATGIRMMTIVSEVRQLIASRWLIELPGIPQRRGRPEVPVAIDTTYRTLVGLSFQPTIVECITCNLLGVARSEPIRMAVGLHNPIGLLASIAGRSIRSPGTAAAGLTFPGLLGTDDDGLPVLARESAAHVTGMSLKPLAKVCGKTPLLLANDTQALAARWMIGGHVQHNEDAVLVHLDDGRLGAVLLVNGRPVAGAAAGASELGHTKLAVATDRCYCGGHGCLERIVSTAYLSQLVGRPTTFTMAANDIGHLPVRTEKALRQICDWLGVGLSNALNLTRSCKLVLAGPLAEIQPFTAATEASLRRNMLGELASRLQVQYWPDAPFGTAETAAYSTLAGMLYDGWSVT